MGLGTLTDRVTGQTILQTFFNDLNDAFKGDLIGRDSSTGAASLAETLGTNAFPWATAHITSLVLGGSAVDASLLTNPVNRIISGKVRTSSNQPGFITPNGAAASLIIAGATTNLLYDVNGVSITLNTDITVSGLTVGPSSTATCLIDESTAADQNATRTWGEYKSEKETITVDNMGAEMQTFIGQWVWLEITGVATEYAFGFIKSTTEITNMYRGYGVNSSLAPVNRTAFTNNDTITVRSTGWIFAENNGTTIDISYKTPIRSFVAPTGPVTGQYWYDLGNNIWNRYDGATFISILRTLIGVTGIDATNCVIARSFDFYFKPDFLNTIELEINSTSIVEIKEQGSRINSYGNEYDFGFNHETWNITTDRAAAADMYNSSEQASTEYYLYVKDTGETIIQDMPPYYRSDIGGYYSTHNPWKCVGILFNDSSSDIVMLSEIPFNSVIKEKTVYLKDEKADTTEGGSFTTGAVRTRDLNTVSGNTDLVNLVSDQFRLLTGDHDVEFFGTAFRVNEHKAWVVSDPDGTPVVEIVGSSAKSSSGDTSSTKSKGKGSLRVADSAGLTELQHECTSTQNTNGFGINSGTGLSRVSVEVYSEVKITRRA